jgi:hypothetical protein
MHHEWRKVKYLSLADYYRHLILVSGCVVLPATLVSMCCRLRTSSVMFLDILVSVAVSLLSEVCRWTSREEGRALRRMSVWINENLFMQGLLVLTDL